MQELDPDGGLESQPNFLDRLGSSVSGWFSAAEKGVQAWSQNLTDYAGKAMDWITPYTESLSKVNESLQGVAKIGYGLTGDDKFANYIERTDDFGNKVLEHREAAQRRVDRAEARNESLRKEGLHVYSETPEPKKKPNQKRTAPAKPASPKVPNKGASAQGSSNRSDNPRRRHKPKPKKKYSVTTGS